MILTKEFLQKNNACAEGYRATVENNLIDNDYDAAISWFLSQTNETLVSYGNWLIEIKEMYKKTEEFVRTNGKELTMGAYQLFNPMTGIHTRYETEVEVKQALIELSKQVIKQYTPTVVQELSNENGDKTWIATKMVDTLNIS